MKNFRFSWAIVGGIAAILCVGLFYDMWRTYILKAKLEYDVKVAAEEAGKYLPFRPLEALAAGKRTLEEKGYAVDQGANMDVTTDGRQFTISMYSQTYAYFAWIVGNPRLPFAAKAKADVIMEGGGPAQLLPRNQIAFAIGGLKEFAAGSQTVIWPSGTLEAPDFAVVAYAFDGKDPVRVGDKVGLTAMPALSNYSSKEVRYLVILSDVDLEAQKAVVKGFAGFNVLSIDGDQKLLGKFVKKQIEGVPERQLPAEHDYGLLQGGAFRVEVKLVEQ